MNKTKFDTIHILELMKAFKKLIGMVILNITITNYIQSSIIWDIKPCCLLKVNQRFAGINLIFRCQE
jgi:hypothetical protein